METPTYEQAVEELVAEARRSASWMTKFCCSNLGHQHGVELQAKLAAIDAHGE